MCYIGTSLVELAPILLHGILCSWHGAGGQPRQKCALEDPWCRIVGVAPAIYGMGERGS